MSYNYHPFYYTEYLGQKEGNPMDHGDAARLARLLAAMRWYKLVLRLAVRFAPTREVRNLWLPLVVFPDFRFPAFSWLPGASSAQEQRRATEGKRFIAGPVSAHIFSVVRLPTRGIVSRPPGLLQRGACAPWYLCPDDPRIEDAHSLWKKSERLA